MPAVSGRVYRRIDVQAGRIGLQLPHVGALNELAVHELQLLWSKAGAKECRVVDSSSEDGGFVSILQHRNELAEVVAAVDYVRSVSHQGG